MGHSYLSSNIHFIWSTKNRLPIIEESFEQELYKCISGIIRNKNCKLVKIGGTADHVHLLINISSIISISDLIRFIKANSSKFINENYPGSKFGWQRGYGGFFVSYSLVNVVKKYIENQKEHHKEYSSEREFLDFLKKHKIKKNNKINTNEPAE